MAGSTTLLRLATAGSVDDGKSTLIGRLLYDSKAVMEDQWASVELRSKERGHDYTDLALVTDGLRAEREQGITIDVAYRYFETPKRKFIIADTPGHVQYTRNMVTGASTAHLAIVLVDARHGVQEQTRRHAFLASLLGIRHIVLAINKMDLVDWDGNQVRGNSRRLPILRGPAGCARRGHHPDLGAGRRQRGHQIGSQPVVRRAGTAGASGRGRHHRRPQPCRRALPRAVRHSPAEP